MSTTVLATLGISSAVFNIAGTIPYIIDIFKHKTKPERATWWIWLMLGLIAFGAQWAAGAKWSLFMTAAQILAITIIASLSIKYGYGKFHRKDLISIIIAIIGIVLWAFTRQPLIALLIVIAVDILGLWLTVTKTWKAPRTETLANWVLATGSGCLGILAVGGINLTKMIYPIYIALGNGLMMTIILYRRRMKDN